jgi:hypothetical protein
MASRYLVLDLSLACHAAGGDPAGPDRRSRAANAQRSDLDRMNALWEVLHAGAHARAHLEFEGPRSCLQKATVVSPLLADAAEGGTHGKNGSII